MNKNLLLHLGKTITTSLLLAVVSWGCSWTLLLDQGMNQLLKNGKIRGLTLVIVNGEKTEYIKGYGFADAAGETPVGADTVFRIGSISKVFTAISAQQLVEAGVLDIQQPLTTYLPGFSIQPNPSNTGTASDITPWHILTHSSGLPSSFFHTHYSQMPPTLNEYTAQFSDEYLAQTPGEYFSYSNTGMTILGDLIEHLSGQGFKQYTDNNIFMPLEMTSTSFEPNSTMLNKLSNNFVWNGTTASFEVRPHTAVAETPAGNLYSNAKDMAKFMKALLRESSGAVNPGEEKLLASASWQAMFSQQNSASVVDQLTGLKFGLGWFLEDHYAGAVVEHGGDVSGFHSHMMLIPEQNLGVFISFNTNSALPAKFIADFVMDLTLQNVRKIKKPAVGPQATDVIWTEDQLNELPGIYNASAYLLSLNIYRQDALLKVDGLGADARLQLKSDGTVWFVNNITNKNIFPIPGKIAEYNGGKLIVSDSGILQRFQPVPIPAAWVARVGSYAATEMVYEGSNYLPLAPTTEFGELLIENGVLKVSFGGGASTLVLVPYADDKAYIHGLGRNAGETVWIDNEGHLRAQGKIFIAQTTVPSEN